MNKSGYHLSANFNKIFALGHRYPVSALLIVGALLAVAIGCNVYFSPNGSVTLTSPLRVAQNILSGQGYFLTGPEGESHFYTTYPLGYPTLIAATSYLTGSGVLLGSKLVNLGGAAIILFTLYELYGRDAWVFSLILLMASFQLIFTQSWTEPVFLAGLLVLLAFTARYLGGKGNDGMNLAGVGISLLFCFLIRYIGAFAGLVLVVVWLRQWQRRGIPDMAFGATILVSGAFCLAYPLYTYTMEGVVLTKGSINAAGITEPVQSLATLFEKLGMALLKSLSVPLVTKFSWPSIVVASILLEIALLVALIKTNRGKNLTTLYQPRKIHLWRLAFLSAAIYIVMVVAIRLFMALDDFGYRYLAPFTFLLALGLLDYCYQHKPFYFRIGAQWLLIVTFGAFLVNVPIKHWYNRNMEQPPVSTYPEHLAKLKQQYHFISDAPTTIAFGAPELDYQYLNVTTPTPLSIAPTPEKAQPMDSFVQNLKKRKGSVYIAIKPVKLNKGPYKYHPSVKAFMQKHEGKQVIQLK